MKELSESEFRAAIVEEAKRWLRTPYKNTGCIRGVGTNCAMLVWGVASCAGVLAPDAPAPRWYTPQLHVHSKDERLIEYVKSYGAREVDEPKPGDIVVYLSGQSHGHAGIVIQWPDLIVHTLPNIGCCYAHGIKEGRLAGMTRRYFSLWAGIKTE